MMAGDEIPGKNSESRLHVMKVVLVLSHRRNLAFPHWTETDMLSINGKALFATLRDTYRGALGRPSIDMGRWLLPLARDYRVHGTPPIR